MHKEFTPVVQREASSYRASVGPTTIHNFSAQMIDCLHLDPASVLIVGKGLGMEDNFLRFLQKRVVSVDIDPELKPDVVASVQSLPFPNGSFDVVICAHVLEHLPRTLLSQCLAELSRVARSAILCLPISGYSLILRWGMKPFDTSGGLRFHIPPLRGRHTFDGEHFWEIGKRGSRLHTIRRECEEYFVILKSYQNPDWLYSYNFVLSSKSFARSG